MFESIGFLAENSIVVMAGGAIAISIFAFYSFVTVSSRENAFKKRMAVVRDDRSAMRAAHLSGEPQRLDVKDAQAKKIEAALSKLQLAKQIQDKSLKARLVRAGFRKHRHLVNFVVAQFIAVPVMAVFAYFGYIVLMEPEEMPMTTTLLVLVGGAFFGFVAPGMQVDGLIQKRQKLLRRYFPDVLDLLTICVESGMSIEQSFNKVADELGAEAEVMVEEIRLTTAELSFLGDRRLALDNFAERTGLPEVKSIVSALIQAEKYGTPVGQALRVISKESRFERMARAESKAAALPAKLTVPMMVFFLPVLFIVILGPAIIEVMEYM